VGCKSWVASSSSCVGWSYLVDEKGEKAKESTGVGAMGPGAIYLSFGCLLVTMSVTRFLHASAFVYKWTSI